MHSYPWYISDWRGSESVALMTLEQRGAYRELLDFCWENGDLPESSAELCRLIRAEKSEWRRIWPAIEKEFPIGANGRRIHRKVASKREDVLATKQSRSESASKASNARWNNASRIAQCNAPRNASRNAPRIDADNASACGTPSPSPSPSLGCSTGSVVGGEPPYPPSTTTAASPPPLDSLVDETTATLCSDELEPTAEPRAVQFELLKLLAGTDNQPIPVDPVAVAAAIIQRRQQYRAWHTIERQAGRTPKYKAVQWWLRDGGHLHEIAPVRTPQRGGMDIAEFERRLRKEAGIV